MVYAGGLRGAVLRARNYASTMQGAWTRSHCCSRDANDWCRCGALQTVALDVAKAAGAETSIFDWFCLRVWVSASRIGEWGKDMGGLWR